MNLAENQNVEAKLTIANASSRQISAAIVVLAGLLSGFFWMGYWTAEMKSLPRLPASVMMEKKRLTMPANEATAPTLIEELGINPDDSVRL
jgi:hypothetical protein